MASFVCQGLQSCLELGVVEPRVLRHKLSPPYSKICQPLPSSQKPNFEEHQHAENSHNDNSNNDDNDNDDDSRLKSRKNDQKGGWNFIQALINPSNNTKEVIDKNETVYVHPLVKHSASALSSKSLEMCTESLGSETGSDTSDISSDEFSSLSWEEEKMQLPNDEFSSLSWEKEKMQLQNDDEFSSLSWETKNKNRSNCRKFSKKLNSSHSFPPPLTSISGSDSVQVRPHREGGRLVIKAVTISSCHTYFQTDRTNGRLRLSLLKECSVNCDCDTKEEDEEVLEHENVNESNEDVEVEEEEEVDEVCWGEDMEGNGRKVGGEIGIQELPWLSRCKECGRGSKGMSSWGHFWVAIS